jgi:glycerol-3-phosphate dehydrogenase subunit B
MAETITETIQCDVAVVGTGMAGMAAAIFAAGRGLSTVCVGKPSEMSFASGCLDLFARIPATGTQTAQGFDDPFEGIETLSRCQPGHPYARLTRDEIAAGFKAFTDFMGDAGLPYHCSPGANQKIITPAGTLKSTFCVPATMMAGSRALAGKNPVLIVDILGLKGFGARQMAQTLKAHHPEINSVSIAFPGRETAGDLMCERLAWDLETPDTLNRFIDLLRPHVKGYTAVGLPAILGIYRFSELLATIQDQLGVGVFEIPTLAPSVTGMRTREAFLTRAASAGIRHFPVFVKEVAVDEDFRFFVTQGTQTLEVCARHLLLGSGRFLGRGLGKGDNEIQEMLFGLPVIQPADRGDWFSPDFFDPAGHPVNRAGIETDDAFRPLSADGKVFHHRLYAAGSILAHQDWKRERSGSGLSIATAFKAVSAIADDMK